MMMPYKQVLLDVSEKYTAIKLKPRISSSAILLDRSNPFTRAPFVQFQFEVFEVSPETRF